ncbi:hypothetical protein RhiJN_27328 [Ceratobasidium sp. AG-Ba]|nr:hypothetical protein RhiJN_13239 [Ceratobasidium sp. AG-Ba]QRV99309.1 hypothetical protein RhiJN_27328 [Ceratobasidium sp. AG-Ba]
MPTRDAFFWYIKYPLYITVQEAPEKKTRTKVAYKLRYREKKRIAYLEIITGIYKNFTFRLKDILERTSGVNRDQILQGDLDKGWFACQVWDNEGNKITKGQISLESDEIPLVKPLLEGRLEEYAEQWMVSFQAAVGVAAEALNIEALGGWDVLRRFFCPRKSETFRLGLYPSQGLDITQQDVDSARKAYKGHMGVEPIILCFTSEAELERNGWFKFSSNPLGMYTTWVHNDDKERLEAAQTDGGKWEREPPTFAQARSFNKRLLDCEEPYFDAYNLPHRIMGTELPVWRGQDFKKHGKRHHERFLGESANKWAKWGLGWGEKDDDFVVAEWLHRVPNRFRYPIGHQHRDMIFGTKECNTAMIRAEAAVIELVNSDQFYQMLIQTQSKCAYELRNMGYPRWITKALRYRIVFQTADPDRSMFEGRSEFLPFSRRHPFRFEYELDRVLLKKCLKALNAPAKPGVDPNPDLLAKFEGGDECGSSSEYSQGGSTSLSWSSSSSSGSSSSSSWRSTSTCSDSTSSSTACSSDKRPRTVPKNALTAEWDGPEGWVTPAPDIKPGDRIDYHYHQHLHRR